MSRRRKRVGIPVSVSAEVFALLVQTQTFLKGSDIQGARQMAEAAMWLLGQQFQSEDRLSVLKNVLDSMEIQVDWQIIGNLPHVEEYSVLAPRSVNN